MDMRQFARLPILLAGLMLYAGQGCADSWQHAISSSISTEFDTNPAMSPAYPGGAWRTLFAPNYTLKGSTGANEFKAGVSLQMTRSSNTALSQNSDNPTAFLDWSRQSNVGEFGISSKYTKISTRDYVSDTTGVVPAESTRTSSTISGRWSKALNERNTLSVNGAYEDVSYTGSSLTGYATQSGSMQFSHDLNERSTPFLMVSGYNYAPVGSGPSSHLVSGILGLKWKAEYLNWTMQAGKSRLGLQGAAGMQYTGQRARLGLNADRQVSSSGLGGSVKADQARGNWSYALNERNTFGINAAWRKNHSITNDVNRSTGLWLQRELSPFWRVRTHYTRKTREGGTANGASSNTLGVSLTYTHPGF